MYEFEFYMAIVCDAFSDSLYASLGFSSTYTTAPGCKWLYSLSWSKNECKTLQIFGLWPQQTSEVEYLIFCTSLFFLFFLNYVMLNLFAALFTINNPTLGPTAHYLHKAHHYSLVKIYEYYHQFAMQYSSCLQVIICIYIYKRHCHICWYFHFH